MFRDEKNFYLKSKITQNDDDIIIKRFYKGNDESFEIKYKINALNTRLFIYQNRLKRKEYQSEISQIKKEIEITMKKIEKLKRDLNNVIDNPCHKPLKQSIKKRSKKQIKKDVLKIINDCKSKNISRISKEQIALALKTKTCIIEEIFMILNRERILSKPIHHALHDSGRDPHGFGGSAWADDIYTIL